VPDVPGPRGSTRERILSATVELMAEEGWGGVTTRAIAERAGVNQALVHYHYRSVSGLLREAAYAAMAAVFEPAMVRVLEAPGPVEALRGIFDAFKEIDLTTPQARALVEAMTQATRDAELSALVRQMLSLFRTEIAQRIAAAQTEGRVGSRADPEATAIVLTALLDGLGLHRLIDPDLDVEAAVATVFNLLEAN
jgi:TetR/AcrR family transcriptional regulator, regulator of biofilm formation and stress response